MLDLINTAPVGNGLAHSVGEAALEPGLNMRKWGILHIPPRFSVGCTKCRFAVGMSKPIPYEAVVSEIPLLLIEAGTNMIM